MGALLLFLVPLALLWVLYIRPQQRRMRQLQDVVQTLKPGDEVVTAGGMYATVVDVTGDSLSVEVAPGVVVRVVRGAIRERVGPPDDDDLDEEFDELDEADEPYQDDAHGDGEDGEDDVDDTQAGGGTSGNGTATSTGDGQPGRDPTTPGRHEDDA